MTYIYIEACKFVQQRGFFLSLFSCNFDGQLSPNFHRFVILSVCRDTPSENACLFFYKTCPVPLTISKWPACRFQAYHIRHEVNLRQRVFNGLKKQARHMDSVFTVYFSRVEPAYSVYYCNYTQNHQT